MIYNNYIEILFILFYFFKNTLYYIFNNDKYLLIKNFCKDLSRLNIVYIKIFQSISINSSFFDKKTQDYLIKYTDNVPFTIEDIDYNALNYIKQYIEIDEYPINSGIFAIVYKGKYNNKDVAVKILKKNIKNRLNNCITNLEIVFYICNLIPKIKKFNLYDFLMQNKNNLINQTSFHIESKNLKNFKECLSENNDIVIPEIVDRFTQTNIMVMNYIEGRKFTQLKKEEYDKYGKLLLNIYFCKNGICNYMHSDLHVGNILFLDNKICILDFGLVIKIDDEYISLYFDLLHSCIIDEDYDFIYNNFNSFLSKKLDLDKLTVDEKNFLKISLHQSTKYVFENKLDLIYLFNEIDKIIKIYNVSININISEIIFSYTFIFNTLNELLNQSTMDVFKSEFKKIFDYVDLDS